MNVTILDRIRNGDLLNSTCTLSVYDSSHAFSDPHARLRQIFESYVKMSICALGMIDNIINIVVFAQIGLSDSITVSFFGLAIADLGFLFFTFVNQLAANFDFMTITVLNLNVDVGALSYILSFYAYMFVDTSILITVFTAVQKCACVTVPLIFKNIFTRTRAAVVISLIYLAMLASYIPLFIEKRLRPAFDGAKNRTKLTADHTARGVIMETFYSFNRITIPFTAQVLVILSMIILTLKLQQAARVRHSMTRETRKLTGDDKSSSDKSQLSLKELRAIRAVALISAIFVACNLPDVVSTMYLRFTPDIDTKAYWIYRLARAVQNLLAVTNSTINIVVYIAFNLKYRNKLMNACGCWCCREKVVENDVLRKQR